MRETKDTTGPVPRKYEPPALTPEQASEFPDPDLAAFALAWIAFRRSSPCTARRSLYPYFVPAQEADMDENDVLFGPDREESYKKLMWAFRRCQRRGLLGRYFDAAHSRYYKSRTVHNLVLLREWADELPPGPGIYTGSLYSVRPENYDLVFDCVAAPPKSRPADLLGNRRHAPELAPSKELMSRVALMKKAGTWGRDAFDRVFVPAYMRELLRPEPCRTIRAIAAAAKDGPVAIACTCRDGDMCRRKILQEIVRYINAPSDTIGADDRKEAAAS